MTLPSARLPAHAYGAARYPRIIPVGDAALSVEFGDAIDPAIHAAVIALERALIAAEAPGIVETAPSYRSLLVCYEPAELGFADLVDLLRALLAAPEEEAGAPFLPARHWRVPVCYGGEHGFDLAEAAQSLGMTEAALIARHAGAEYTVFFLAFAPGLPNLGGLPKELALSRRAQPRPRIPAGSVVMAGGQAAVMSRPMPSGWHVLGRTPVRAFDPARAEPFLFRPGDVIRFCPVDPEAFAVLETRVARGEAVIAPEPPGEAVPGDGRAQDE